MSGQVKERDSGDIVDIATLKPCAECRADGKPWEIDCDQCNPDGMFIPFSDKEGHWYTR